MPILHRIIFILFLACQTLMAQVPGYEGRLWPIHLDVNLSPAVADWVFQPEGELELNWRLGLEVDRVLSRRISLGANASILQSRQNFLYQGQTGFLDLDGHTLGIQLKNYRFLRRGNLAPLGPYQKWELQYLSYHIFDPREEFPVPIEDQRVRDLAASFTLGTRRMLGEHFTYHIGIQTAFVLNLTGENARRMPDPIPYLNQIAIRRLRGIFAVNLNAGIGVLLF